jgi:hypothetical protein
MIRIWVVALLLVAPRAFAQSEVFIQTGALYGADNATWTYEAGFISRRSEHFGIGFAYYNEGHLFDNHRDGLTAQAWYLLPLSSRIDLEVGTGPYATMNNTTVDGDRVNEFKLGVLSSVALKWRPTAKLWYLRAQYNNVWVPNSVHSNALLLGIGRDFQHQEDNGTNGKLDADLSIWGGWSRTTQVGAQRTAVGYEVEAKKRFKGSEHLAWSVGLLSEGDTNLANRKGIPIQFWYNQPVTKRITVSAGIGPYIAYDGIDAKVRPAGIGSLRATISVIDRYELGIMYTRVASFYNRDQDIAMIGFLAHL